MPPGKLAAQAGHAFVDSLLAAPPSLLAAYRAPGHGTKVTLCARNLHELTRALHEAEAAGLPCALITDEGHILPPHFTGAPIVTALGIGPALRDHVQHITRRFEAVK